MAFLARVFFLIIVSSRIAIAQKPPSLPDRAPSTQPSRPAEAKSHGTVAVEQRTWTVENQDRIALLHVPSEAKKSETPVVFAFHGHGGNARQASRSFNMHELWPEAIVVYMEGLPTPGALTDPEGKKNGWQNRPGLQGDRDLKFFDAVLATLKNDYKIDERRIYAMGHSNGGGFTYLLWQTRPNVFAAFAPSGSFTGKARDLTPKPAMHIAGRNDELVKFEYQERTIEAIKKVDGCAATGENWAKDCTLYPSTTGTPVVTMVYEGTHKYPAEAPALIVKFFKGQAKPAPPPAQTKQNQ